MHTDNVEHRFAIARVALEWAHALCDFGGLIIGFAGHKRSDSAANVTAGVGIVRDAHGHEQRAEIGIAEAERTVFVRVFLDAWGGIAGVIDQDFLGGYGDVDGVTEAFDIEHAIGTEEFQEIERGQVAGRVVEEHVFRAGIGSVDPVGGFAGVPSVDGRVVLHARIAALPCGFGHAMEELAGAVFIGGRAIVDVLGPPIAVFFGGLHELVGNPNGMIGVLEEDGGIGFAIDGLIVALLDEDVSLALLFDFGVDELGDVRMVDVEDDHLGGAPSLTAALDDAGEGVEALHE